MKGIDGGYPGSSLSKEEIEPRQNRGKLAKEIDVFRTGFHLINGQISSKFCRIVQLRTTISKTSARVSSGFPNTKLTQTQNLNSDIVRRILNLPEWLMKANLNCRMRGKQVNLLVWLIFTIWRGHRNRRTLNTHKPLNEGS